MRYPAEHKQATHERILAAAGALLRRTGAERSSIERVMSGAGLTVGGFYAHFSTKRALIGETLRWVFARKRKDWLRDLETLEGRAFLEAFVRRYLSRRHRDLAGQGCPVPAVLSELPRAGAPARRALEEELEILARELELRGRGRAGAGADTAAAGDHGGAGAAAAEDPGGAGAAARPSPRQRALATLALCFGGMALARAVQDRALSDEVLLACRKLALAPPA